MTALRSLVAHHDVTWIASAMTDEDRAVADEAGGAAIDEVARDGSPYRLRLVAHDPAAYDWFYNVVANPTLWFLQHYLWALAYPPDIDPGLHHAWDDGYVAGQPLVRRRCAGASSTPSPTLRSSFTTTTSISRRGSFETRGQTHRSATSCTSRGPSPTFWRVLPSRSGARSTTGCSRTTSSAFTPIAGAGTSCARAGTLLDADCDFDVEHLRVGGGRTFVAARPISVDPAEFDELAESDEVLASRRSSSRAGPSS